MAISIKPSKEKLKNHMSYSSWKYILLIACAIFGWDLVYTTTAYRPPEEKRVDVYIMSSTAQEPMMTALMDEIRHNDLPEEIELVQGNILTTTDYYGDMQLSTYMGAGEGDVYILPSATFKSYASGGAFLPLGPLLESGALDTLDIDLTAGYVALVEDTEYENEDGEPVVQYSSQMSLYGIPLAMCEGLPHAIYADGTNLVLAVTAFSGNEENVIKFVNSFLSRVRSIPPEALATPASETPTDPTASPDTSSRPEE